MSKPGLVLKIARCLVALAALGLFGADLGSAAKADNGRRGGHANRVVTLHHYGSSVGHEITNLIAVSMSKLRPLVPAEYTIVPASNLLVGSPDQGVLVVANVRGFNATIDRSSHGGRRPDVIIDVAILIAEPAEAASVGVNIPGAFHLYALRIFTNDSRYADSLRDGGLSVEFIEAIDYERRIDDATGVGDLEVSLPGRHPFLYSVNTGQGYAPIPGSLNAVFWHEGARGTAVLSFANEPFRQGSAISRIYTRPHGTLDKLLQGGGLGQCPPDPKTRFNCILAPSLNLRYDQGWVGKLQLITPARPAHRPFPAWVRM